MLAQPTISSPHPHRSWISAMLSMLLHTVFFVLLTLVFTQQPAPALPTEAAAAPTRPIEVALVTDRDSAEYFTDSTKPAQNEQQKSDPSPQAGGAAAQTAAKPVQETLPEQPPLDLEGLLPQQEVAVDVASLPGNIGELTGPGRPSILPGLGDDEILAEEAARQAAAAAAARRGPQTVVSVFDALPVRGGKFCFIIDRSQSMGGQGSGAWGPALAELRRICASLDSKFEIQVIAYNDRPLMMNPDRMERGGPAAVDSFDKFMSTIAPAGGTKHYYALLAALRIKPDAIILITDGGDPTLSESEQDLLVAAANQRTAISTVHFRTSTVPELPGSFANLARRTGGKATQLNAADLPE